MFDRYNVPSVDTHIVTQLESEDMQLNGQDNAMLSISSLPSVHRFQKFNSKNKKVKNMKVNAVDVVGRFRTDESVSVDVSISATLKRLKNNFSIKYTPGQSNKGVTNFRTRSTKIHSSSSPSNTREASISSTIASPSVSLSVGGISSVDHSFVDHSSIQPSSFVPTSLDDFRPIILNAYRRLILEDLLFIEPSGDTILILLVPKKSSYSGFYSKLQNELTCKVWDYQRGTRVYYQFKVKIIRNVRREDFTEGLLTETTFNHLVFGHGNEGVTVQFVDHPQLMEMQLCFNHFFSSMVELWAVLPYKRNHFRSLKDRSNVKERNRLFNQYLRELEGDVAGCMFLLRHYDSAVKHNGVKLLAINPGQLQHVSDSLDYDLGGEAVRLSSSLVGEVIKNVLNAALVHS